MPTMVSVPWLEGSGGKNSNLFYYNDMRPTAPGSDGSSSDGTAGKPCRVPAGMPEDGASCDKDIISNHTHKSIPATLFIAVEDFFKHEWRKLEAAG